MPLSIRTRNIRFTPAIAAATTKTMTSSTAPKEEDNDGLERKIGLSTEGFMTKYCESILRYRSKLSIENAMTVSEYIIMMKREINPRLNYVKYTIEFLSALSRAVGITKKFIDMKKRICILLFRHMSQSTLTFYTFYHYPLVV
jgi:hypothetical protein